MNSQASGKSLKGIIIRTHLHKGRLTWRARDGRLFTEHRITANVVNGAVTLWKRRDEKEAVNNKIYLLEGKVGIVWGRSNCAK